jgi:hypothetical protein
MQIAGQLAPPACGAKFGSMAALLALQIRNFLSIVLKIAHKRLPGLKNLSLAYSR